MFLYIKTNILRGYGIFKNDFAHPREPATSACLLDTLLPRVALCLSASLRIYLFKLRYRRVKPDCVEIVMDKTGVGDWFLLYLLGQNIDHIVFKDVFHELAKKLGYRSKDLTDP